MQKRLSLEIFRQAVQLIMGEAEKSEPVVPVVLSDDTDSDSEHDPQFEPLMHLPIVDTKTLEEGEAIRF